MIARDMEKSNVMVASVAFLLFNNREMTANAALGSLSACSQGMKQKTALIYHR